MTRIVIVVFMPESQRGWIVRLLCLSFSSSCLLIFGMRMRMLLRLVCSLAALQLRGRLCCLVAAAVHLNPKYSVWLTVSYVLLRLMKGRLLRKVAPGELLLRPCLGLRDHWSDWSLAVAWGWSCQSRGGERGRRECEREWRGGGGLEGHVGCRRRVGRMPCLLYEIW